MTEFLQFLFSGVTVGSIYALTALGFIIIYNASGVVNFAQGEFVMIGGMTTAFAVSLGMPLWAAALVAVVVTVIVGLLLQVLAIRPARDASVVSLIIITIGASIFLKGAEVGVMLAVKGFAAAMLGGMGSPIGAIIGGLALGLVEAMTAGFISSTYKDAVPFLLILLVLVIRPQGLIGSRSVERV